MQRGSDKVSPRRDDALAHDTEGLVRGGLPTHAEEWKDPEPVGEDQPIISAAPGGGLVGGTPPGLDPGEVDARSELATYLGRAGYPLGRDGILDLLRERNAPDRLVDAVSGLPGRSYDNLEAIWVALGGGAEHRP